ncbi:hypothetical protein BGW38_010063 [Lunasporangiospora selenospora]|uniref:Uncharacterized protein n=1 Tax=Lunasporangiospora selenospora TaxID=979761 RepID=A0A9P6FWV0_9FUNG|nr:hypothetical protein BGW38_010063 [Lunasporangiospora selenospora]
MSWREQSGKELMSTAVSNLLRTQQQSQCKSLSLPQTSRTLGRLFTIKYWTICFGPFCVFTWHKKARKGFKEPKKRVTELCQDLEQPRRKDEAKGQYTQAILSKSIDFQACEPTSKDRNADQIGSLQECLTKVDKVQEMSDHVEDSSDGEAAQIQLDVEKE